MYLGRKKEWLRSGGGSGRVMVVTVLGDEGGLDGIVMEDGVNSEKG